MEVKIYFNARSRAWGVSRALEIAKKLNGKQVKEMMVVESSEFSSDLWDMFVLISNLSKTEMYVNGMLIKSDFNQLKGILYCPKQKKCRGKCTYTGVGFISFTDKLFEMLGLQGELPMCYSNKYVVSILKYWGDDILLELEEDKFRIDINNLISAFHRRCENIRLLCPKFNENLYVEKLKSFNNEHFFMINLYKGSKSDSIQENGDELGFGFTPGEELFNQLEEKQRERMQEFVMLVADEVERRLQQILGKDSVKNN